MNLPFLLSRRIGSRERNIYYMREKRRVKAGVRILFAITLPFVCFLEATPAMHYACAFSLVAYG